MLHQLLLIYWFHKGILRFLHFKRNLNSYLLALELVQVHIFQLLNWLPNLIQHVVFVWWASNLLDDAGVARLGDLISAQSVFQWANREHLLKSLFPCCSLSSYWTCLPSGIGQPTWLTTANPPANTWESTHTLHWPCWRS